MASRDLWAGVGSALAFIAALITMAMNQVRIKLLINKMSAYFSPYIQITIPEYSAKRFERSELFVAIEAYLSEHCIRGATKLKAELVREEHKPNVSVDDEQEIIDKFQGTTLWWYAYTEYPKSQVITVEPGTDKRRFYRVSFHRSIRKKVLNDYVPHVLEKGRAVIADKRQRCLFTNNPYGHSPALWSNVVFQHTATFDTLAMDPTKKKAIIDDLEAFKKGKDYYGKVGKAWKRGYLLFGPPGTGKSTMVAAIANFLEYDVYDLELTAVNNNTELRKLFVETKGKSIIVIEDIDRSISLTVKRTDDKSAGDSNNTYMTSLPKERDKGDNDIKLTLSGMLNVIDGLWSACGSERIIIFTTNNKSKLDPALIRRGRMDMHIEMSYCRYEAFKVLARNYLPEINDHQLFDLYGEIRQLLEEVDMSPADVAEHLMLTENKDADACFKSLVVALKNAKDDKANAKEETVQIYTG
uniref:AAA+ ATPase domain-containing protein n=1 Tax=Oryza punctata TaxID=4537 RepID=A0A0E0MNC4_ORYPU